MPDGGGDIQVHTDDMLIRPKKMYEYATSDKGASRSEEARLDVRRVRGGPYRSQNRVRHEGGRAHHGDPPPGPLHRKERERVRGTKIKVSMCTTFKPTDEHEVDIHDPWQRSGGGDEEMAISADTKTHHVDMHDASRMLACESSTGTTHYNHHIFAFLDVVFGLFDVIGDCHGLSASA
jgi:hypothetical protein